MDKEFNKGDETRISASPVEGRKHDLGHGDVVIAAITSCTNTSNPNVMIGAGLLARKAAAQGPQGQAVGEDLARAGLAGRRRISRQVRPAEGSRQARLQSRRLRLHHLHRQFRARCRRRFPRRSTTTISSPPRCSRATATSKAASTPTCAPTISPRRRWSSPMRSPARCRSTWPRSRSAPTRRARRSFSRTSGRSNKEIGAFVAQEHHASRCSRSKYADVFKGDAELAQDQRQGRPDLRVGQKSTYVQNPPYFVGMEQAPKPLDDIVDARVLGAVRRLDHHRPHLAGRLDQGRFAGRQISESITRCKPSDFNQYGTRRGNHEVMMRGTFANIRLKNQMVPGVEGGFTVHYPSKQRMPIYDAAMRYKAENGAAGRLRRQGIRHRLVARLGGQGHGAARHARRGRAVVRAHPSLQPDRHGRGAAGVRGRHVLADARPEGRRAGHDPRPARRAQAAAAADRRDRDAATARSSACR